MIDLSGIQAKDEIRRAMAEQIAAWEAENGPVQTLPIRIGDAPVETFSINVPGKPKVMPTSSQALRAKDHARVTLRTQKKMAKVQSIRELAVTGMRIADIAERLGFTAKYVQRIILEHAIKRKMDLEA